MKERKMFLKLGVFVLIVGIIFAIIIPAVLTSIRRAERSRTVADIRAIGTALGSYQVDNNQFPLKYEGQDFLAEGNFNLFQVFVRKAELYAVTNHFEKDKALFYAVVKDFNATIKFENFSGVKSPYRRLTVRVVVEVDRFKEMIDTLKGIGELTAIDIQTIDKTEDFRKILSQKKALETHLDALQKLRSNGGEVDKLILLEEKILAVEREIHQSGVQLGDFVQKESFGNVEFSLVEEESIWTSVKSYLYYIVVSAFIFLIVLYIIKKVLRKSSE